MRNVLKLHKFSICLVNSGAYRCLSTSSSLSQKNYKVLVIGGGTGGCTIAAKYASKFGKGAVAVIEPNEHHYYQPMWTLVGAGIKNVNATGKLMKDVIPSKADWIKESAASFDPEKCTVTTNKGEEIKYEYLIVAMGLQLNYHLVKGLPEALKEDPMVCSNYWRETVVKTFPALEQFKEGNAVFTFPNTPVKCAGAPQKILYLAEDYFRKNQKRDKANMVYNTSLPVIFGIKKYADALTKICQDRNITVNTRTNLIEVNHKKREAVFEKLDSDPKETVTYEYSFLHATPPMSAPDVLKKSSLVDGTGFLDVNKFTLQHVKYPNIFGIGDCTNVPTAKTAAAVAGQSGVLKKNLNKVMAGKSDLTSHYDGYTSCPLITQRGKCILAEFGFDGKIMETFPIDQSKERRTMYHMKKDIMPELYWRFLLKGMWEGPAVYRKLMRLGMKAD